MHAHITHAHTHNMQAHITHTDTHRHTHTHTHTTCTHTSHTHTQANTGHTCMGSHLVKALSSRGATSRYRPRLSSRVRLQLILLYRVRFFSRKSEPLRRDQTSPHKEMLQLSLHEQNELSRMHTNTPKHARTFTYTCSLISTHTLTHSHTITHTLSLTRTHTLSLSISLSSSLSLCLSQTRHTQHTALTLTYTLLRATNFVSKHIVVWKLRFFCTSHKIKRKIRFFCTSHKTRRFNRKKCPE